MSGVAEHLGAEHLNEANLRKLAGRERFTFFGLTLPYLLMVAVLIIIPIGWLFYLSFIGRDGTLSFENYTRMVESKAYIRIFITTFKISFLTTLICALIGYPLAYFMSQLSNRWANIYDRRSDSVLDKLAGADICVAGSVTEKRACE